MLIDWKPKGTSEGQKSVTNYLSNDEIVLSQPWGFRVWALVNMSGREIFLSKTACPLSLPLHISANFSTNTTCPLTRVSWNSSTRPLNEFFKSHNIVVHAF